MVENPQIENGFLPIANELVEALARTYLSSYESQFLWCLFRKTYGWGKREDWIALTQIAEMTGMHLSHVSRTKKKLIERRIVTQTGNKIAFNKFWSQWKRLPKQVTPQKVTQTGLLPPPIQVITPPPKQAGTKDTVTKDTFTTDSMSSDIVKWFTKMEVGNPRAYLLALQRKASPEAIGRAWKDAKRGVGINSPGELWERALHYQKG